MITLVTHGHTIEIQTNTAFTAVERVIYDGQEMSRHASILGSTHTFTMIEDEETIKYDVKMSLHLSSSGFVSVVVHRNGQFILSVN